MQLPRAMVLAGVVTALWCGAAAPAPATYGARTAADEPQYLLSALSLYEDGDLDISDELVDERWRAFHRAQLPEQTRPIDSDRRLSPHDPLLPVLLALPMGMGGWLAAKLALAGLAGVLAALVVWVGARRFAVPVGLAAGVTLLFSLAAPLAPYGSQVYPELPAALAVTVAVAGLTGPLGRRGRWLTGAAVVALPWLAVKYVPVAAALAAVAVWRLFRRGHRREALALAGGLAVSAAVFLAAHRVVYGGWTVYAAGDHFVDGELTVVGTQPDWVGRSRRLVGLLTDRSFGLAAWAPAWLLAVPATAALARRRPPGWAALALPLSAGWLTATFVALTMHGFWWPGRQTVVVLPLAVVIVAWWVAQTPRARPVLAAAGAAGVLLWGWVAAEALTRRLRLVIDFDASADPLYRAWRLALPDYRHLDAWGWALHGAWVAALVALAVAGWRTSRPPQPEENLHDIPSPPAAGLALDRVAVGSGRLRR